MCYCLSHFTADECARKKFTYGTVCVCNATYCDRIPEPKKLQVGKYALYTTSNAGSRLHPSEGSFVQSLDSSWSGDEVNVDVETTYQTVFGFGGAFTDSAGINIKSLSPETQQNLLKYLITIIIMLHNSNPHNPLRTTSRANSLILTKKI